MVPTLVLFDHDGTLVDTAGAGRRGLERAFERVFGAPSQVRDDARDAGRGPRLRRRPGFQRSIGATRVGALLQSCFRIGVGHILSGPDLLLFVAVLLLIAGGGWLLVWTVTAFTVAHSLTLGLAKLGNVGVEAGQPAFIPAPAVLARTARRCRSGSRLIVDVSYTAPATG